MSKHSTPIIPVGNYREVRPDDFRQYWRYEFAKAAVTGITSNAALGVEIVKAGERRGLLPADAVALSAVEQADALLAALEKEES